MTTILLIIAVILIMIFPWLIPLFILLGVILYLIKKAYRNSNYGKKQTLEKNKKEVKQAKELQERMNSCGVFPTYSVTNSISTIYFDENNRKIYLKYIDNVLNKSFNELALNIDNIISYGTNINTDSNIQYTMGTYFSGKFKVNENINAIWFTIQLNSIDTPYINFLCSDPYCNITIPEANEFANKIIGALDYMKNNKITKQKPLLNIVPNLETEIIEDTKTNIINERKTEDKIKVKDLQNKLNKTKKERKNNVKKNVSKTKNNILNGLNYGIAFFLYLGAIVCLIDNKISYSVGYIIMGTPFLPFIYEKIWKNRKVSKSTKIVVRIIFIILSLTIGVLFLTKP